MSSILTRWQLNLFYLIVFLIPANLAKHFILPSSYVSGQLVDYLIPSLYLTDILIIILLSAWLLEILQGRPKQLALIKPKSRPQPWLIFIICLLPSVLFASSPLPAVYKFLKLLELSLFCFWFKSHLDFKKHLLPIINLLTASILFQSALALVQWFKQASVFGYWFFGEQPYTASTPGIDKIVWFDGSLKIPPLGTFPHPNVLAGFLVISLLLILQGLSLKAFNQKPYWKILCLTAIALGITALFLTFSLSAWLAFLLIGLPLTINSIIKINRKKFLLIYTGALLILFSLSLNFSFLAPESSFTRRSLLAKMATTMLKANPLTGVGLNNFTVVMDQYGYIPATTRFLQPVHNIFLLVLTETGLIGFLGFIWLLIAPYLKYFKTYPNQPSSSTLFLLCLSSLLFLGLFDHYPLTLQPGLLLLFLFLGLLSA